LELPEANGKIAHLHVIQAFLQTNGITLRRIHLY
jgi:hypothetical protein